MRSKRVFFLSLSLSSFPIVVGPFWGWFFFVSRSHAWGTRDGRKRTRRMHVVGCTCGVVILPVSSSHGMPRRFPSRSFPHLSLSLPFHSEPSLRSTFVAWIAPVLPWSWSRTPPPPPRCNETTWDCGIVPLPTPPLPPRREPRPTKRSNERKIEALFFPIPSFPTRSVGRGGVVCGRSPLPPALPHGPVRL